MAAAGHVGDEPCEQLADDVRRGGELRRRALPLREDVDQQRERERMPVGELEHAVVQVVADARGGEQGARVARREVAQRQRAQELAPAGVLAPAASRRLAPGDHHERVLAEAGDELLADPRIEAGRGLVGVEQQHAPSGRGERRLGVVRAEQRCERRPESGGRQLDGAQVEPPGGDAGRLGVLLQHAEQRGLADAAGAVDPQHGPVGAGGDLEPGAEQLELAVAADEPASPRAAQPPRERGWLVAHLRTSSADPRPPGAVTPPDPPRDISRGAG